MLCLDLKVRRSTLWFGWRAQDYGSLEIVWIETYFLRINPSLTKGFSDVFIIYYRTGRMLSWNLNPGTVRQASHLAQSQHAKHTDIY